MSLTYVYRTHDQDNGIIEEGDVVLNYYATDMNIVNGDKDILINFYYEIPASAYNQNTDKTTKSGSNTIYLRKLPGTVETIAENGVVNQITIPNYFINTAMYNASSGYLNTSPLKIYIGAQTRMNVSQNENEYIFTAEVFDEVTFRERNLFNLD